MSKTNTATAASNHHWISNRCGSLRSNLRQRRIRHSGDHPNRHHKARGLDAVLAYVFEAVWGSIGSGVRVWSRCMVCNAELCPWHSGCGCGLGLQFVYLNETPSGSIGPVVCVWFGPPKNVAPKANFNLLWFWLVCHQNEFRGTP